MLTKFLCDPICRFEIINFSPVRLHTANSRGPETHSSGTHGHLTSNSLEIIIRESNTYDTLWTSVGQVDRKYKYGGFSAHTQQKSIKNVLKWPNNCSHYGSVALRIERTVNQKLFLRIGQKLSKILQNRQSFNPFTRNRRRREKSSIRFRTRRNIATSAHVQRKWSNTKQCVATDKISLCFRKPGHQLGARRLNTSLQIAVLRIPNENMAPNCPMLPNRHDFNHLT